MQVCLTLTAKRMASKNCLVKNLEAVEEVTWKRWKRTAGGGGNSGFDVDNLFRQDGYSDAEPHDRRSYVV